MGSIPTPEAAQAVADRAKPPINIVCVRVGQKYGPEYVTILCDQIARNASTIGERLKFWCLTDAPGELHADIAPIPHNPDLPGWWQKVFLFSDAMPWKPGERVAYFDLDLAITGRLEDMLATKGIIRDWLWPCYNSSAMIWDHGEHREVWERFDVATIDQPGRVVPAECLPVGEINGGDQEWITEASEAGEHWRMFPADWCVSYRDCTDWPTTGAKVISFNGKLKPAEIKAGWVPDVWKVGGFTSLPEMDGANVSHEGILQNIRANVLRCLPWFTGFKSHGKTAVLVCGAPSMRDYLGQIKDRQRRGAHVITVNNAWRPMVKAGIMPDVHVMLDARPENLEFLEGAPEKPLYLLASQCHPTLFEALDGKDVRVWHNGFGTNEELMEVLAPYWEAGPNQRPCILVPGGGTVGLRTLWLSYFAGYRTIHIYGMDSSYAGDGAHHAYPQALNDDDAVQFVALRGKKYRCARWMVRQAEEFKQTWADLKAHGVTMHVHGTGLIPDLAKGLRAAEREAA